MVHSLSELDFGTWRPNILIGLSLIAWGIGFGWLGVHEPAKWEIATGLYIVGRTYIRIHRGSLKLISISHCISDNSYFLDCSVSTCLHRIPSIHTKHY